MITIPTKLESKQCQSCIERGYSPPNKATHEWQKGYFICDECYQPLLSNIMQLEREPLLSELDALNSEKPLLSLVYEVLDIPVELQFSETESILQKREEIFNHHAKTLINMDEDEIREQIETYQCILFQFKIALEPRVDYINRLKSKVREEQSIKGASKSAKEIAKKPTSKVKLGQQEKLAKSLGISLEKLLEAGKEARLKEFEKVT